MLLRFRAAFVILAFSSNAIGAPMEAARAWMEPVGDSKACHPKGNGPGQENGRVNFIAKKKKLKIGGHCQFVSPCAIKVGVPYSCGVAVYSGGVCSENKADLGVMFPSAATWKASKYINDTNESG